MQTIYIDKPDDFMVSIARSIGYSGRKFKLEISDRPINVKSYWSGGSREYYHFVSLSDKKRVDVPAQSAFDHQIAGADNVTLPAGICCVQHTIFCGKDLGLTFIVRPDNAAPMLPAVSDDLTRNEKIVLAATCSLKSFARIDEAKRVTGISLLDYNAAKDQLIASGHLLKNGGISPKGRNAIGRTELYQLR
jgi:hypothetical protein